MRQGVTVAAFLLLFCGVSQAVEPRVIAEEPIYTIVNPKNGSGPLWSYGCSPIARVGDRVFASQMETGEGVPLLCNTRWRLLERTADGWTPIAEADQYKQREPTILTTDAKNRLYLYVNDSLMPPGTEYGPCEPHLLLFDVRQSPAAPQKIAPKWQGTPTYTDHSYRGYAADAANERILMFNIDAKTSVQNYCLLTMTGDVLSNGGIAFPIRACYSQVALENNRAHILAVGDIVEPVEEWRTYKFEQTQSKWDYVFRRLFYTVSPDAEKAPFGTPVEIANVDATAGHISNQDLWIAPNGDAHVLYTELEVGSALMRDKFFPGKSTIPNLKLAIVHDGAVLETKTVFTGTEQEHVGHARFHVLPNGDVWLLAYIGGQSPRNVLIPVHPKLAPEQTLTVPFKAPFSGFLLASTRAGNAPSNTIDVLGVNGTADTIAYGQIRLD